MDNRTPSQHSRQLFGYITTLKDLHILQEKQKRAIKHVQNQITLCDMAIKKPLTPFETAQDTPGLSDAFSYLGATKVFLIWFLSLSGTCIAICLYNAIRDINVYGGIGATLFSTLLLPGLVVSFIITGIVLLVCHTENIKKHQQHVQIINKHNESIKQKNDSAAIAKKHAYDRKQLYTAEIHLIESELQKTNNLLDTMYSYNIIYPKYRKNIVYICSIFEYFDSKICDCLEGPYGAYARLENDIKFGVIIDKLDVIINKLDLIIENQKTLYNAIMSCNMSIQKLDSSINNLALTVESSNAKIEDKLSNIEFNIQTNNMYSYLTAQCELYRTLR